MKKKIWVLLPFIAILPLIFSYIDRKELSGDAPVSQDSYMEGVRIVQKNNGDTKWELVAKRADISGDGKLVDLSGIVVTSGRKDLTIETEEASYDLETKVLSSRGMVVAKNSSATVTAGDVQLVDEGNVLKASGTVSVTGKKFNLQGKGLLLEPGQQKIKVLSDVKAVFHN